MAANTLFSLALWNKGMFGLNYPGQATDAVQNWNQNESVAPLRQRDNLNIDQWFAHGMKNYPPAAGDFMTLPSGGTFSGEISCNRAKTACCRQPWADIALTVHPCGDNAAFNAAGGTGGGDVGPLHTDNRYDNATVDPALFGGTALAIAYTSDVANLKPSDMTVISVNQKGPWTRVTDYRIPAGMPPCPAGGCLCTWNWLHTGNSGGQEGYPYEMYNVLYRCNVTGNTNSANYVKPGTAAVRCDDGKASCNWGAKQPMYVWMAEGSNVEVGVQEPNPTYNNRYGYYDGAQTSAIAARSRFARSSSQE